MNAADLAKPPETARVLELLKRHGWNATSFQILEDGFRYWFDGDDACVAYVDTGAAWVAAGAPIADVARIAGVAERFAETAERAGRRVCFFATEMRFQPGGRFAALHIGEQPVWDPAAWQTTVARSPGVRAQLRRAAAKGAVVRAVDPAALADAAAPIRRAIESLIVRWLGTRTLAPMGFLVDVQPFSFAPERRYFVAERDGAVVGFLAAVPVFARGGWLLEDLLRDPGAPNGTAEALVDAAMRTLSAEGSRYVTLGLAPLAGPVTGPLAAARQLGSAVYDFRGVRAFREKLRPDRWDPIFLHFPDGRLPVAITGSRAIYDSLTAFARGRMASFGIETLLRGPALVVRLLAALLIPWTALLTLADATRWFPAPAIKWGWVCFDVALIAGLFALATRWRRRLGIGLAVLVTADAVLTAAQVAGFNAWHAHGPGDWIAFALSLLGPTLAAAVLWGAVGHRARLNRAP